MKIRQGFVSNSSSSSFILKGSFDRCLEQIKSFTSTNAEAVQNNKCDEGFDVMRDDDYLIELFKTGGLGIAFQSVNYDTYITCEKTHVVEDEYYLNIETCNNTEWDIILPQYNNSDDDSWTTIHREHEDINRFFVWVNRDNIIRSMEHWAMNKEVIGVRCFNKKCDYSTNNYSRNFFFDENLVARCSYCDEPLSVKPMKTKIKMKEYPDNVIGGIF